jgi:hypothetical protein
MLLVLRQVYPIVAMKCALPERGTFAISFAIIASWRNSRPVGGLLLLRISVSSASLAAAASRSLLARALSALQQPAFISRSIFL